MAVQGFSVWGFRGLKITEAIQVRRRSVFDGFVRGCRRHSSLSGNKKVFAVALMLSGAWSGRTRCRKRRRWLDFGRADPPIDSPAPIANNPASKYRTATRFPEHV
jgi:hypothetical protein